MPEITQRTFTTRFGVDIEYLLSEWKQMLNPKTIPADLWAGITVALVALPLNLALAIAAGVEPGVGITTGIVAGIVAALFGGQRLAVTGPAAAMAVVLIEISQTYGIKAVWLVCILAGLMQILAGSMRLGKLISYIPMPVIVGFANAIGVLVFANALDDFLGMPTKAVAHPGQAPAAGAQIIPEFLIDLSHLYWRSIQGEINFIAMGIGILSLAVCLLTPRLTKAVPGQLVAIVVATTLAGLLNLDIPRIRDISSIPSLLPNPSWPDLPWSEFSTLFPTAITVFMLGSIESLLSATVADGMSMSRRHHSNQELIGQGLANSIVPFFGGIPVTGVIARTAVNIRSGAKTRLASMVHSIALAILIFFLAKHAEQIPLAALAAILVLTGIRLIEWDEIREIWRGSRMEGYVVAATTLVSVAVDLTAGVIAGLVFTCGLFIRQMSNLRLVPAENGTDPVLPDLPTCKFVRSYLVDGPLFFGATERFVENIVIVEDVKVLILHMKAVSVMDITGVETLLSIHNQLRRHQGRLVLAELPAQPMQLLERTSAIETIGRENIFHDYRTAVIKSNAAMLQGPCAGCQRDSMEHHPKDCKLRSALLDAASPMSRLLANADSSTDDRADQQGREYLVGIESAEDIPLPLRATPIGALLKAQNLGLFENNVPLLPQLVIGMCIDYRKALSLPADWAFVIRREGANMQGSEFALALALSQGLRYMALIAHNRCAMSNTGEKRQAFINALVEIHHWSDEQAAEFFDDHARSKEIGNEIDFVLDEARRLSSLFPGLVVVPMLYRVEDDRLYLICDWLVVHYPDDPLTKRVIRESHESDSLSVAEP